MRKIYIDFDNTLFNTIEFNRDCTSILEKYDIEKEEQIKTFKSLNKEIYDFKEIIEEISKKYNIEYNKLLDEYKEILKNNYLYDDSISFLKELSSKYELILLTYGNNDYQLDKINCASIGKYFSNIIITQKYKFNIDIDYKNSIFIDDNPRDLKGLLNNNSYKVIRIKRGKYKTFEKDLEVKSFDNLNEILEYIEKLEG